VQECDKKSYLKGQQYNKIPCAVDEKLWRENFKYTHCHKQRQENLNYTEKTFCKNYFKTMATIQEYPEEFVV